MYKRRKERVQNNAAADRKIHHNRLQRIMGLITPERPGGGLNFDPAHCCHDLKIHESSTALYWQIP